MAEKVYPGGSRSRVNAAGRRVRSLTVTHDDLRIIDTWRAAHRGVLNTFQASLRNRTKGKEVIVAQRLKRKVTLFDKLLRFPTMELSRMDDVAGCRLIFADVQDLYAFRANFHNARFNHRLRNQPDKYDYIKKPKADGYRGIHDVYEYNVNSSENAHLAGLNIELQYRTRLQHSWATAEEILGNVTPNSPKFKLGDPIYSLAMTLASEILARVYEAMPGPIPQIWDRTLVKDFINIDRKIGLRESLRSALRSTATNNSGHAAKILMRSGANLQVYHYRDTTEALQHLFELEREFPLEDVVLVRSGSDAETAVAFGNYYNNAEDFLNAIDEGVVSLANKKRYFTQIPGMPGDGSPFYGFGFGVAASLADPLPGLDDLQGDQAIFSSFPKLPVK